MKSNTEVFKRYKIASKKRHIFRQFTIEAIVMYVFIKILKQIHLDFFVKG